MNRTLFNALLLLSILLQRAPGELRAQDPCQLEACSITGFGTSQRMLWIPGLPGPANHLFYFDADGGHFEVFPDGTARVYGNVQNGNLPEYEIYIDMWFKDRMAWEEWSALGRSWKGDPDDVGELYQTWDYFIMDPDKSSTLVLGGAWEGTLDLTHRPSSYLYGFQVGEAANDQNSAHGMSCWMDYTGTVNGEWVEGNADINGEGVCEELPLVECLADITVDCFDGYTPAVTGTPGVLCPESSTLTYTDQLLSACPYVMERTWTVVLESGASETCIQQITIVDETPPALITALEDFSVSCDQVPEPDVAFDDCGLGSVSWEVEETSFSGACLPTIQRTYTATDDCGNAATASQFIAVIDTVAPVLLNSPEDLFLGCGDPVPPFVPEATDQCDTDVTVGFDEHIDYVGCDQIITQTWTVQDDCGNAVSTARTVTITDDSGPELLAPLESITIVCTAGFEPEVPEFVDACGALLSVDVSFTEQGEGCAVERVYTWTATDACGFVTEVEQTVFIQDTEPPVFADAPTNILLNCGDAVPPADVLAIDACGSVTTSFEDLASEEAGCSAIQRTYTALDACGNTASLTQLLVWQDNEAPVLSGIPSDSSVACGLLPGPADVTATDACYGAVEVVLNESIEGTGCGSALVRTWTAVDACGNSAAASQTITLEDNEPPVFAGDVWVEAQCGDAPELFIAVQDDCSLSPELTFTETVTPGTCGELVERVYTATDDCGNSSTFNQTIAYSDQTPPVFVFVPADVALGCIDEVPPVGTPVVEDNCGSVSLAFEESWEGSGCGLQLVRTWTALDDCGNSASAQQVLLFGDSEAPVFETTLDDVSLSCGDAIPAPTAVTATDDCGAVAITFQEASIAGACAFEQTIVRTWVATDGCGNQAILTQNISVSDETPPVFQTNVADVVAQCGDIPPPPSVSATDDCGDVTVSFDETFETGGCPNIIRTWTATDACGNSASLVQLVQVEDTEPPVLEGIPSEITASCNNLPDLPEPEVSDNCDEEVAVTYTENIIGSGCEFTILRTWIASDDCGNTAVISQSVHVVDEAPPVFLSAPDELFIACSELESVPFPNVTDDCGSTVLQDYSDAVLGSGCTYDVLRTWTAQDACGNTATATQLIHVTDQTPPAIIGVPPNTFVSCGNIPEPVVPVALDACSDVVDLALTELQFGEGCDYTIQRVWTATDACGNSISIARLIIVQDDLAPVFTDVPEDISFSCLDAEMPPVEAPTVVDDCTDSPEITYTQIIEAVACGQVVTRWWYATDACGNTATASQTITFADTDPPVIEGVPEPISATCGNIPPPAEVTASDACDSDVILHLEEEVLGGFCPFILRRTWTAIDACGNMAIAAQDIEVTDLEAPVLNGVPADVTVGCGELPEPGAVLVTDNCQDAEVVLSEVWTEIGCTSTLVRTWTATDPCGNSTSASQTITVLDEQAPVFPSDPEDATVECAAVPDFLPLGATDDCFGVEEMLDETVLETECDGVYTLVRQWTATDICGNATSVSQVIEVVDSTPPQWPGAPEDLEVACGEVPPLPEVNFTGECSPEVTVAFSEDITAFGTLDESTCDLGNAVTDISTVAIWLPDLPGYASEFVFDEAGGTFIQDFNAGTATVTGQVFDPAQPSHSWRIEFYLENRREWEAWSEAGGSYKDDFGAAGDLYQTWSYYTLSPDSRLIGQLDFSGSVLELTHAPASLAFGFQVGEAANNRNAAFGMSGWFFYSGSIQGMPVNGVGDLMTENQCCVDQDILRTWVLTDCAGNASTFEQTIQVRTDLDLLPIQPDLQQLDEGALDVWSSTGDYFRMAYRPEQSGDYVLTVCDLAGNCVERQDWKGLKAGERRVFALPKQHLKTGQYVFTVVGEGRRATDRETVLR